MYKTIFSIVAAAIGIVLLLDIPPRFWAQIRGTPVRPNYVLRGAVVVVIVLLGSLLDSCDCGKRESVGLGPDGNQTCDPNAAVFLPDVHDITQRIDVPLGCKSGR